MLRREWDPENSIKRSGQSLSTFQKQPEFFGHLGGFPDSFLSPFFFFGWHLGGLVADKKCPDWFYPLLVLQDFGKPQINRRLGDSKCGVEKFCWRIPRPKKPSFSKFQLTLKITSNQLQPAPFRLKISASRSHTNDPINNHQHLYHPKLIFIIPSCTSSHIYIYI